MSRITEFVDSFIPDNLSKSRKAILKSELTNHILDKAEYYMEIGYTEADSTEKAIEDFGTDKEMKDFIFGEFEELYCERDILGVLAFVFVWAMNILCFPLDLWVTSADYNRDTDPFSAFCSFVMIFCVLLIIIFARIKKYRKTLIAVAIANITVAALILISFYPQMASYAMGENIVWLIDRFTPFSMGDMIVFGLSGVFTMALWYGFLIVPSLYSIITAIRLKRGSAKKITDAKKKVGLFTLIYFAAVIITCALQPTAHKYIDDYPVWFSEYAQKITDELTEAYDEISIGGNFSTVSEKLHEKGYFYVEEYVDTLDKLTKKQFLNEIKDYSFIEGYSIWFNPETKGHRGFLGIREENGIVTGAAVGNLNSFMYERSGNNYSFSYYDDNQYDMDEFYESFENMKSGDSLNSVMDVFGERLGKIYTEKIYYENDKLKHYYRIHTKGIVRPEEKHYLYQEDLCYLELYFSDFSLEKGILYIERREKNGEDTLEKRFVK